MKNIKTIQKAVAISLVHDTTETLQLIRKYQPIQENVSYYKLLLIVDNLLKTNINFTKDYIKLLVKNKRLIEYDFNNAEGKFGDFMNNLATGGAFSTGLLSNTLGLISSNKNNKHQADMMQKQTASKTTDTMLQMMMNEENNIAKKKRQDDNLIIGAGITMVLFIAFLIYTKKK